MTLSIISGLLAIPLIVIASFGEVDALGPWDVGELECTHTIRKCHKMARQNTFDFLLLNEANRIREH